MRVQRFIPILIFSILAPASVSAQQTSNTATKDQQAVTILGQCLQAAGGLQAMGAIQDFTGTGNVTYFWAGQQVQGQVTVRGMGSLYFRLDATLPEGARSWAVRGVNGSTKETSGQVNPIGSYNAINEGTLTLPYSRILTALNDSSISISSAQTATLNGRTVYKIQTQKLYSSTVDPLGEFTKWSVENYLIDANTLTLSEMQDTVRSNDVPKSEYQHEIIFSNYTLANGVLVPYSITERVSGQETWTIQLSSISFNVGLTDADFNL
ncbi:MAG TPA: hypothetical protein VGT03_04870 [Candidatus Acidoferrales bacterium]|nr:hypothetical protein [Candidatus Acidoferrales bacterium]